MSSTEWERPNGRSSLPAESAEADGPGLSAAGSSRLSPNAENLQFLRLRNARLVRRTAALLQLRAQLIELAQQKPDPVIVPNLFYEDTNNPALVMGLAEGWPSSSIWSDEGGVFFGSHSFTSSSDQAMALLALANKLWGANSYDRTRLTMRSAVLEGRRLTFMLMLQPLVMDRVLQMSGGAARGMGFLARFLPTWPTSKIGERPYRKPASGMPRRDALAKRLTDLLNLPLPFDPAKPGKFILEPPVLWLQGRAKELWVDFYNGIEFDLGKDRKYADVADIGSKIAEQAARMAGGFHVFENGPVGAIDDVKTMDRATRVAHWHLNDAQRILSAFDMSKPASDAEQLLAWSLSRLSHSEALTVIDPRTISQSGPRPLRKDRRRRNEAIAVLVEHDFYIPAPVPAIGRGVVRFVLNPRAKEILL
jgi:hypothetical protein